MNKAEKNSVRDSLQRRARKFVSSYGKMIFDFLQNLSIQFRKGNTLKQNLAYE
jgi:hypothetical protein